MIYFLIAIPILYLLNKGSYGIKIRGRKNLKQLKKQGFITVSNHVHVLDCTMVALAVRKRKITFTSLGSNFDIPVAGHLVKALGVIPTPGSIYQTSLFLKNCQRFLNNNRIVHVYPEGHLIPYYDGLRPFNKGAFKIATKNNVPVLPVVLSYRKRKGLYRLWLREKPCLNITILSPVYPNNEVKNKEAYMLNETYTKMNEMYKENNTYIFTNNNSLERMDKLEAKTLLINKISNLGHSDLEKLDKKLIDKALNGKVKKKKILEIIDSINKIQGN